MAESPLTIWAVSDGRAGIEAQAVGLAQAVARRRPAQVEVKTVRWKGRWGRLPWRLIPLSALAPASAIAPPWPDVWIAAGRATLPLSTRVRRWSQGRTFVVQVQHPRTSLSHYDLVVPPRHDGLTGPNVFPITGAPQRLTAERLAQDLARFADRIRPLPAPRVAVLIGGKSKAHDLSPARAAAMGAEIAQAVSRAHGSVLVTFSRRTPQPARRALTEALGALPGWIWDETGENPYFAFLAAADVILVTEDSTNLATEAAFTGKPVQLLSMDGRSKKLAAFHADLAERGALRSFRGRLETWAYPPLDETGLAAEELLRRLDGRRT
ncbi:mitochondrial fission ELM1 family protein [Phenylobacterium terrae]|uniref:Mitochondrial fission ELM1 family protein n=1 Tax=Phenylobacterium terrae TaxID=2665495 RepID=A0ABW4N323_9CAUL